MTQTAPAPQRLEAQLLPPLSPAADDEVVSGLMHRWWRLGWQARPDGPDAFALIGVLSSVVWSASVAAVPCARPTDLQLGACPCSLHAPSEATGMARALSSIVVGGHVRVLATQATPHHPTVSVATVEGPLRVVMWCDGAHDGFTHDRCGERPRLVVPAGGIATALCRRHARGLPRGLRGAARRLGTFRQDVGRSLSEYGVAVFFDDDVTPAVGAMRTQPLPSPERRRVPGRQSHTH